MDIILLISKRGVPPVRTRTLYFAYDFIGTFTYELMVDKTFESLLTGRTEHLLRVGLRTTQGTSCKTGADFQRYSAERGRESLASCLEKALAAEGSQPVAHLEDHF